MRKLKHPSHSLKRAVCLAVAGMMVLSTALTGCGSQENITSHALENESTAEENADKPTGSSSGSGEGGVSIRLDASKKDVNPGENLDYTITMSTTEYTGEAKVTLALDDTFKAVEAVSAPIQRGQIEGQGTNTITFTMTEFKPDDPEVVLKVTAQAPDDLDVNEAKAATASISYDGDKNASASVYVNVKEAYPTTGATNANVTLSQVQGGDAVEPGTKVRYRLAAAMSSEISTVTNVKDVQLHIDIPSEFTGVEVTGYKNGSPFAGSFTDGTASADFSDVRIEDALAMEVEATIAADCTHRELSLKGYASGTDITSNEETMKLLTTEAVNRVKNEPSVYMTWKDLNSTKDRTYRTSDVLPVSILVTNKDANTDLADVAIAMKVPEGFHMIEDLEAQGIVSEKTEFAWNVEKIEKGGKFTIDFGLVPDAEKTPDKMELNASVYYANHPLDKEAELKTNTLKASREIPKAEALTIRVMQDNTDKDIVVAAGQNVVFGAVVTNDGETDLKNIEVKGTIDKGLIYGRSNVASVVQKDGVVTWTIPELKAGKSETMLFGITVPKKDVAESYSFYMEGKADDIKDARSNTITMKTGSSDMSVEMFQKKSGMKNETKNEMSVKGGETYSYIIKVKNKGTAEAKNVTASMQVPGSLTLNQSSLAKGMVYDSSTLKWTIGDLAADADIEAEIKVTAPTGVSTNTSSSKKDMTLNVSTSLSWADGAGKQGASESNKLVTVVEKKTDNSGNSNNNSNNNNGNNSNNGTKQPVNNSGLDTVAVSRTTNSQMLAYQDADTVRVTAKYTKLRANTHYTGTVGITNESGGIIKQVGGSDATIRLDFTTSATSGTIGEFDFTIDGKAYAGKCLYAAINVTPDNGQKSAYNGVGFEQSTIRSATVMGAAVSYPTVNTSKSAQASSAVSYTNVQKGLSYQAVATLIDRSTGKALTGADGKEIKGTASFKASDNKGQVNVPFTFSSDDVKDKDLAVYVTLYDANGRTVLAVDEDLNRTKTSGSTLTSNNASKTNTAKGDGTRETVKTGENDHTKVLMILFAVCAMAGAGYAVYRKRDFLSSLLKK